MNLIKKTIAAVTAKIKTDTPSPYKLADNNDNRDWDRTLDGLMADNGTYDDDVQTVGVQDAIQN